MLREEKRAILKNFTEQSFILIFLSRKRTGSFEKFQAIAVLEWNCMESARNNSKSIINNRISRPSRFIILKIETENSGKTGGKNLPDLCKKQQNYMYRVHQLRVGWGSQEKSFSSQKSRPLWKLWAEEVANKFRTIAEVRFLIASLALMSCGQSELGLLSLQRGIFESLPGPATPHN